MRKIVTEAEKCKCCGQTTKGAEEQTFCDQCGKQLTEKLYSLDVSIANGVMDHEKEAELCSWKCVRAYVIANRDKISDCWYVNLPMPVFRENNPDEQHCDSGESFFKDFLLVADKKILEGQP